MSYPERVNFWVFGTGYYIDVDISKAECTREPAHCHVTDGNRRIAKVWLSDYSFEGAHEIASIDQKRILCAIDENRDTVEYAYNFNQKYGTD